MNHYSLGLVFIFAVAPTFADEALHAQRATSAPLHRAPLFKDVTWEWGLLAQHRQQRESLVGLTETLGAGACVLDFNHDGWMDLLLVGGSGQRREFGATAWWQHAPGHRLYRNESGTGFVDITASSGLQPSWGMGCATADWDADGDEDLLITGFNSTRLYRNKGGGRFVPVAEPGINPHGWATSASVADYDGDGRLDIYIAYFVDYRRGQHTFEASAGFKPGLAAGFNPALHKPQPNRLYRNLGGLRFEDRAASAGVANPEGRSLQGLWADLNGDKKSDLVVLNAPGSPAVIYLNDRNGNFSAADSRWKFSVGEGLRGATWLPGSGGSSASVVATTGPGAALSLARHAGSRPVNPWDTGLARDTDLAYSAWGVAAGDFDNNGTIDLVTANGAALPDPDAPGQPLGQSNRFYRRAAEGNFTTLELDPVKQSSRGIVSLDVNNDGTLDLLVTSNNDAPQLLLNTAADTGRWIGFAFQDRSGHPLTHGVEVTLSGEDWTQTRRLSDRQGFLSSSEPRLHFGLALRSRIEVLQILWPDGSRAMIQHPASDRYLTLRQGQRSPQPVRAAAVAVNAGLHDHERLYHLFDQLYIRLLVRAGPGRGYQRFLHKVTVESTTALMAAIQSLPRYPEGEWLFLLARGIQSADPGVRLRTLDTLQRWELEASVRYLLPLLQHEDAATQCRTAQVFETFFRQEEAVIRRKYLALPVLVKLLEHENPSVQMCAMRALAETKRFRGLHSLLELAAGNKPDVAREAVRTLGRIRQRRAVPALEALAARSSEDPELGAEVGRALAQLRAKALPGKLSKAVPGVMPETAALSAVRQAQLSRLTQGYRFPSAASERALLSELDRIDDVSLWDAFLDAVDTNTARGKRLLLKNLHHPHPDVVATVIAHTDPLVNDAHYDKSLWRLLLSPHYPGSARLALADKLGQYDAARVIGLLPGMGKAL